MDYSITWFALAGNSLAYEDIIYGRPLVHKGTLYEEPKVQTEVLPPVHLEVLQGDKAQQISNGAGPSEKVAYAAMSEIVKFTEPIIVQVKSFSR